MPLPATYTRATILFKNTSTGARAHCALYYLIQSGTPPTLATIATYANAFATAYSTALQAWLTTAHYFIGVTVKYVTGGTEVEGDSTSGPYQGSVTGDTLPELNALVIQKRTGKVGRNKRGRIFIPFVPENFQDEGELVSAGITAATAIANMVKSSVTAGGASFTPQNWDHKSSAFDPIIQSGYLNQVTSRRDRGLPKQYVATHL